MPNAPESSSMSFLFRDLDSKILIGMACDRYAGRIGRIYSGSKTARRLFIGWPENGRLLLIVYIEWDEEGPV
jgi:hypothetical protein